MEVLIPVGGIARRFIASGPLPNLPVLLIEPHRNREGVWRIKFCYETDQSLSMSAVQASAMAIHLHQIGEVQLAGEINDAVRSATRYESM